MTNSLLTLDSVSYTLPDGRTLFSGLDISFDTTPTGLVGRNGVGKSVLARLLAGQRVPTSGRIVAHGSVHYLAQEIPRDEGLTVADIAGQGHIVRALGRIESGSTDPADFDLVGDHWDVSRRLAEELETHGLGYLHADTLASSLSGGEATRVALVGAFLSMADLLILDEPSNHLDRGSRHALIERLGTWERGLIVVSHDRALLRCMDRIVELSEHGLRSYGGNYDDYAEARDAERETALSQLAQRKAERRREERLLRERTERAERRQARGAREGRDANQAPILLGRRKEGAENSAARIHEQNERRRETLNQRVSDAMFRVDRSSSPHIAISDTDNGSQRLATLKEVELPYLDIPKRFITLTILAGQRIRVIGANGTGKSTLLRVLAGDVAHLSGERRVFVPFVWIDQQLAGLDSSRSITETILSKQPELSEGILRNRLSLMGLDTNACNSTISDLSHGQRLIAHLANGLLTNAPARLLILDEPSNHLDLETMKSLEFALRLYKGALVVTSHDEDFLQSINTTHVIDFN